eukprot:Plantae.Rhodophyta-Hildenbrandia_rubra.ctg10951.p1 GENE.Plantae.Rhodophyta-Hildenbrandia_rubra.ctg10951~~Plantae.Rhodophyta-Hildenbrandia_rubra.ctg10951.p1  ORF type:complete len:736 (-),score=119.14 Plantae.Rhodophyta-Hildenbrandia_rubra.ctg10951:794-3001(-)
MTNVSFIVPIPIPRQENNVDVRQNFFCSYSKRPLAHYRQARRLNTPCCISTQNNTIKVPTKPVKSIPPSSSTSHSRPQTFDFTTLALTLLDLRQILPLRVQSAHQPDASTLAIHLLGLDGPHVITISYGSDTRARLTVRRPNIISSRSSDNQDTGRRKRSGKRTTQGAFSLGEIVFSLVAGLVLVGARLEGEYERVGCLEFGEELGGDVKYRIYVELLGGGRNNMVIVNDGGVIKAAGRQVSDRSAKRALQTGRRYESYPPPQGLFVEECQIDEVIVDMVDNIRSRREVEKVVNRDRRTSVALVKLFAGLSPVVAEELARCADIDPKAPLDELSSKEVGVLSKQVGRWYGALVGSEERSACLIDGGGYSVLGWSAPSGSSFVDRPHDMNTSEIVECYYSVWHDRNTFLQMHGQVEKYAASQMKKWSVRESDFREKLAQADGASELQHQGDLLFSYAHTWSPESEEVACQELDESIVTIKIPRGKTPEEYGSSLHKKAQKLRKSREIVTEFLNRAKMQKEYWQSVLMTISMARNESDLAEISDEVAQAKATEHEVEHAQPSRAGQNTVKVESLKRKQKANVRNPHKEARKKKAMAKTQEKVSSDFIRIRHEPSGYQVIIGRNNRQNERLSFTEARKSDLWLHVADKPGAHVICRNPDGGIVEQGHEALTFAADLAAWFSSARESKRVDVNVVNARELRRIGGSPRRLGLVGFVNWNVLEAKPDRVQDVASPLTSKH